MESVHKMIILDEEDKWLLKKHQFNLDAWGYPRATIKRKCTLLHNIILPLKKGFYVDHVNRNPLDNRRCNLRYVTPSQNSTNSSIRSDNTSGYRGVSLNKISKKWIAKIKYRKK